MLTQNSVVVATQQNTSCVLGDEITIVNLKNSTHYGLRGAGTHIWELLDKPRTIGDIQDLLQKFDVDPERCRQDVLNVLQGLADEGSVDVR